MIEIEHLTFSYTPQKPLLEDICFRAGPGSLVAVLGPNGAGKSTLFRCIFDFIHTYSGRILVDGGDVRKLARREMASRIAYIPQSSAPVFNYTVREMVLMGTTGPLSPWQSPGKRERMQAERAMEELGILEMQDRGVGCLSGGERQLVLIARAIAQNARLLVMDEPTANLDYGNQYRVLEKIKGLTDTGYTILMSSHNPDHALRYATDILALHRGGVYTCGPAEEVLTQELIHEIYRIPVTILRAPAGKGTVRSCIPLPMESRHAGKEVFHE